MGVAKLKKAELYYHKSVRDDVTQALQRSGACQIIEPPEDSAAESRGPQPEGVLESLNVCEEQQGSARYLFRALGNYYTDPVPPVARMLGEMPSLSLAELTKTAKETDLKKLVSSVKEMETELNELRVEASQLSANAEILSNLRELPYSLNILSEGTRGFKGVLGTVPAKGVQPLSDALAAAAHASETDYFVTQPTAKNKDVWVLVVYSRTSEQAVMELCVQNGVTFADIPSSLTGSVPEELARIQSRLAQCGVRESEILQKFSDMGKEWMPAVQKASDYWRIQRDRYQALASSEATSSTVRTTFWVPADALPDLQKKVESVAPGVAFAASDPTEEDRPPSLLRNNAFSSPAEALTLLFSPPLYGRRDPTSVILPFFLLFFGMCLADAGYGLIMAGVLLMLFKKYRKIPANIKTFMRLFLGAAIATVLYGLFTGGIFGDFIDVFPFMAFLRPLKDALLIVNPMKDLMTVLGLSLFLGVVQLMFGLGVAAYDEFRAGNYADALGGKAAWILFVVGLLLFAGGSAGALPALLGTAGKGSALVGGVLIFWYAGKDTKNIFMKVGLGLYALYGGTGYLGDILSYSRLLALGLGGGIIGSVVNMLALMISGVPYVGWLLAALVVIGGHLFSLAINLLGSFIHAMRLQFVEFFGKFYTGDGTLFTPLKLQTQYVEVFDE